MTRIEWALKAVKQLRKLPQAEQVKVHAAVGALAEWPDVRNVKALVNRVDYRLRVGRYRVLFHVTPDGELTVININEVRTRDERTY